MDSLPHTASARFGLTDDQIALRDMALGFAAQELAPHALEWDRTRHLPVPVLRKAAALGMGAIYCREEFGGTGLGRHDAAIIFEALATGCPTISAFISHPQHGRVDDRPESAMSEQRERYSEAGAMELTGGYCLTEPGSGSRCRGAAHTRGGERRRLRAQRREAVHLRRRRGRCLCRYGARRRGPNGSSPSSAERCRPACPSAPTNSKMGWHMQSTRQVIFEDCRVPAEKVLSGEGAGFGIAMAGLDGGRLNIAACSLGRRAVGARQGAVLHGGAQGVRLEDRPVPGAAIPAGRHGDRAAGSAHLLYGAQRPRSTARRRMPAKVCRWPSASSPIPASTSPTRRCSCMAVTAICQRIEESRNLRDRTRRHDAVSRVSIPADTK